MIQFDNLIECGFGEQEAEEFLLLLTLPYTSTTKEQKQHLLDYSTRYFTHFVPPLKFNPFNKLLYLPNFILCFTVKKHNGKKSISFMSSSNVYFSDDFIAVAFFEISDYQNILPIINSSFKSISQPIVTSYDLFMFTFN